MTLETALAENTAALKALNATQEKVVVNQERMLAGQQAAIDKIDGAKPAKTPKIGEKVPATTAAKTDAPKGVSDDDVKAAAIAWMNAATKGKSEAEAKDIKSKVCAVFLGEILTNFGVGGKLTGPESKLDDDQRKQAKFYIERKPAGLPVDFNAEYNFDESPTQGATAEAEEDPLG